MTDLLKKNKDYSAWLKQLKTKVRQVQLSAAVKVNQELLLFYWSLGEDILERQKTAVWGEGFLSQLSRDLSTEFPDMKGFSRRNLELIRKWRSFWTGKEAITKQLVSQLPWGHNLVIISKIKSLDEANFYVQKTLIHGWSRAVLTHQIEGDLYRREGKAVTNFQATLPPPQSDLAQQTIKDPYNFDFLSLRPKHDEKELEDALLTHVARFLLELGSGFSYLGRQFKLTVGGDDFYLDLLFYHVHLHCYVVVELKTVKFEPEFAGKLNFYVSAVDGVLKTAQDNPSVGILICKSKNKTVVEYTLKDVNNPIGVSEYTLTQSLPDVYKSSLPTIEEIEAEFGEESLSN
jgi:predicted nuclease of restriction endonuclease-like (RecB) superfamily